MKTQLVLLVLACTGCARADASDSVSAARYTDAQGVEVIHNRNVQGPAGDAAPSIGAGGSLVTTIGKREMPMARKVATLQVAGDDPKLRINASEQEQRDRDRLAILQQELEAEVRGMEDAARRAKRARTDGLNAAQSERITKELYEHQQNILALHAELRRVRTR